LGDVKANTADAKHDDDWPILTCASLLTTPIAVVTAQPNNGAMFQVEIRRNRSEPVFGN
jgi:hypothetical protein